MKYKSLLLVFGPILCLVPLRLEAASLKVAPARFMVHDVQPGSHYDLYARTKLRLTIYNDDTVARTWVLTTHRPSERGKWERGYSEIPDPRWCWFTQETITVEPNSKAYAYLFLQIPDRDQYYNQHWVVTLGVGSAQRGGIGLAVDIRMQIETKSKEDVAAPPEGPLGLVPSMLTLEDVRPGVPVTSEVRLYNNEDTPREYTLKSLFADKEIDRKTYLTQSFAALPDLEWMQTKGKIRIGPKQHAVIPITLGVPAGSERYGEKWENLLLVQPDEGRAGFVRVRILTMPETEGNK